MIKKQLFGLFTLCLLISTINPAVADCDNCTSIPGDPMWGTLYMPDGRVFESLYVKDGDAYVAPIEGETDPHKVLYNIPLEGEPVPLRQVPTLYITDGDTPVVIDQSISLDNPMRGLVFSGTPNPITLADWIKGGKSKLKIRVREDGMTHVKVNNPRS